MTDGLVPPHREEQECPLHLQNVEQIRSLLRRAVPEEVVEVVHDGGRGVSTPLAKKRSSNQLGTRG